MELDYDFICCINYICSRIKLALLKIKLMQVINLITLLISNSDIFDKMYQEIKEDDTYKEVEVDYIYLGAIEEM